METLEKTANQPNFRLPTFSKKSNHPTNQEKPSNEYTFERVFSLFFKCGTFKELVFISDTDKYMVEVGSSWHSALQKGIIVNTLWPACPRW